MKPLELRSLNIDIETHKAIKLRAAEQDCQMKDGVRDAWTTYLAALANPDLNKCSESAPAPSADLIPSLSAVARKLAAAKAELEGIIARNTGEADESADTLIAAIDITTARARAAVEAVGRGPGMPGGAEGSGEEVAGGDGPTASPTATRRGARMTGGGSPLNVNNPRACYGRGGGSAVVPTVIKVVPGGALSKPRTRPQPVPMISGYGSSGQYQVVPLRP